MRPATAALSRAERAAVVYAIERTLRENQRAIDRMNARQRDSSRFHTPANTLNAKRWRIRLSMDLEWALAKVSPSVPDPAELQEDDDALSQEAG